MTVERYTTARGVRVPTFLYGTAWKEERTRELVEQALAAGFTGLDTANQRKHYHEAAVGEAVSAALRRSSLRREDIFLQSKFTHVRGQDHRLPYDPKAPVAEQVAQSFRKSLEHLQTDFLDSYLLHGPSAHTGLTDDDWEAWHAMEILHTQGKTRLIGVSNVTVDQLRLLCEGAGVRPAFVQNRCYARDRWDHAVRAYCAAHDIVYQGFSLLTANARELRRPEAHALAERLGRPLAAVVFRFAQQLGMIPLTGTSSQKHLRDDLACYDFQLSEADVALLTDIGI